MSQFPVEGYDGVRYVSELVVGQAALELVVEFLAVLGHHGELSQIAYVASYALCVAVEYDDEYYTDGERVPYV